MVSPFSSDDDSITNLDDTTAALIAGFLIMILAAAYGFVFAGTLGVAYAIAHVVVFVGLADSFSIGLWMLAWLALLVVANLAS